MDLSAPLAYHPSDRAPRLGSTPDGRTDRQTDRIVCRARHGIPSVAHQRLTPVSLPAYSSPLMPYLLMDEDDVVVLPRRRTLARLSDELDDDPVLKWYEDRIHHAQVEASSIAQSHINDLCTPKPRHISVTPMYTPKLYPEPVAPRLAQYTRHRSRAAADPLKPVRRNIELKSRFNSANDAAQNTYKRMGDSADPAGRDSEREAKPAQPESTNGLTNGEEAEQKEE